MEVNSTLIDCHDAKDASLLLFHFLILDAPTPSNLPTYIKELQKRPNMRHLVRVCGPTYDAQLVQQAGIQVHSWPFDDGAPPTRAVIESWFQLLDAERKTLLGKIKAKTEGAGAAAAAMNKKEKNCEADVVTIGVHCVAGLGRAPILVALALVEYQNMQPLDAIQLIRDRRKGAINQIQMQWLTKYKRRGGGGSDCTVM